MNHPVLHLMKSRKSFIIPTVLLIAYSVLLIQVMVFKNVPMIKVGSLMLNFGGTREGAANLIPFSTILPYLFGSKGFLIGFINLMGNIVLLIPIGILLPFIKRGIQWKSALIASIAAALAIECMQVAFKVGIFDIDDVILNAFGAMIGFWISAAYITWFRQRKHAHIIMATVILAIVTAVSAIAVYNHVQPPEGFVADAQRMQHADSQSGDLCGTTRGTGEVMSVEAETFTLKRNDGANQMVRLSDKAVIETPTGIAPLSDLKAGNRVTLVGGPNTDGSFTADAVFVCGPRVQADIENGVGR